MCVDILPAKFDAVEDFTTGTIQNQPVRRQSTIEPPNATSASPDLVADWGADKTPELIEEMIVTALKIGARRDGTWPI